MPYCLHIIPLFQLRETDNTPSSFFPLTITVLCSIIVPYSTIRKRWIAMEHRQNRRAQQTREQIRAAAQELFLQHGYLATSTDAILAEAGISSKETLYRHYASKEELFVDVLGNLTLSQPRISSKLSALPAPHDLPSLRQALATVAREIFSIMIQPEYLALLRVIIAETPRFPQLGPLFRATVPERGLFILTAL